MPTPTVKLARWPSKPSPRSLSYLLVPAGEHCPGQRCQMMLSLPLPTLWMLWLRLPLEVFASTLRRACRSWARTRRGESATVRSEPEKLPGLSRLTGS